MAAVAAPCVMVRCGGGDGGRLVRHSRGRWWASSIIGQGRRGATTPSAGQAPAAHKSQGCPWLELRSAKSRIGKAYAAVRIYKTTLVRQRYSCMYFMPRAFHRTQGARTGDSVSLACLLAVCSGLGPGALPALLTPYISWRSGIVFLGRGGVPE